MDLRLSADDEAFRSEAREWLADALGGEFAEVRGRGGPGDEDALVEERRAFERALGAARWACPSFPSELGGRGAGLLQQVLFHEEYARAGGPGRVGIVGAGLLGPTILHFGTDEQRRRFLPPIAAGTELWCQGYSEPGAGSDLANVSTRAELAADEWVVRGQKVWTSLAHWADWCFVLCRTEADAPRHRGLSYLLVPMRQPGIEIRPIVQCSGGSEFNEVFFDGARTAAGNVVGGRGDGWRVAMGTLAFERGASTLGQQLAFARELDEIVARARARAGRSRIDATTRQRIADLWVRLRIMRYNALRSLGALDTGALTPLSAIHKLFWASLHRELGRLAVDTLGADALVAEGRPGGGYHPTPAQRLFLFTRADTIYGGSNQIQRNVIGERVLALPPEPKVV